VFHVLSIDGGGIRGIIPATVLVALEALVKRPLGQVFDLVVGTSTGGLLSLALAAPRGGNGHTMCSPSSLLDLYTSKGDQIFRASSVDVRSDPLKALVTSLGGPRWEAAPSVNSLRTRMRLDENDLGNARYSAAALEAHLRSIFGDTKLSDAVTDVVVTSYDMAARQPILFRSRDAKSDSAADAYLRDVGRATSAAPTYFPPHEMVVHGARRILIDGGVVANNPAMIALVEAIRIAPADEPIHVLSVGTGAPRRAATGFLPLSEFKARPWPVVAMDLMQTLFDGDSQLADHMLAAFAQSLPQRITSVRLQADLGDDVSGRMDDASQTHIQQLIAAGAKLAKASGAELDAIAQGLSAQ